MQISEQRSKVLDNGYSNRAPLGVRVLALPPVQSSHLSPEQPMSTLLWVSPIKGGLMAAHIGCSLRTQGPLQQAGHANATLVCFLAATEHITSHHTIDITALPNSSGMKPFVISLNSSWEIPAVSMGQSEACFLKPFLGLRHFSNCLRFFISRFTSTSRCMFKVFTSAFNTNGLGPGRERELRT